MRLVVVLCGPPGAGKTTAAQASGLTIYDRDDPKWSSDREFIAALDALGRMRNARAVVIRSAPTSKARRDIGAQVNATHTYLLTGDRVELARRIHTRNRDDALGTLAGLDTWFGRHDRYDGVLTFPGWKAITGDQLDLGITS